MTEAVSVSANALVAASAAAAPKATGTLAASIHTDRARVSGFSVTARVQTGGEASAYAIVQHEGAGPHIIRPVKGKALAFNGTFATIVHHPGNPATKYIERPLLTMRPEFMAAIRAAAAKAY